MKAFLAHGLFLASLYKFASGINILDKVENPKVIHLGLEQKDATNLPSDTLIPQLNSIFYAFNFSLGTPAQTVQAVFDTGSRDLIINIDSSARCSQNPSSCLNGVYSPANSTSEGWVSDNMSVAYELGGGSGSWVTDKVSIGSQPVNFQLGIYNTSSNPQNYWGFGYGASPGSPKNTTLETFVAAGAIKSASTSFRLANPPSFVLGGLDINAYTGKLVTLPIVPAADGTYDRAAVALQTLTVAGQQIQSSDFPIRVMVDTGNFDIKLPADIVYPIWQLYATGNLSFPSPAGGSLSFATCPCSLNSSTDVVSFGFNGISVNVPVSDLVQNVPTLLLQAFGASLPAGTCVFNVNPIDGSAGSAFPYIIGGAFLKNVYTVLDTDSKQIAFGALSSSSGQNPQFREISAGSTGLNGTLTTEGAGVANTTTTGSSSLGSPSSTQSGGSSQDMAYSAFGMTLMALSLGLLV